MQNDKASKELSKGNKADASTYAARAYEVTPETAQKLIEAAKYVGVDFIVAPYEADAQLAYLSRSNFADVIITEDSDLLVFGAQTVLYKFNFQTLVG